MKQIIMITALILSLFLAGCSGTEKVGQAIQVVEPDIAMPVMEVTDDTDADDLAELTEDASNTYCPSFINHYCGPLEDGSIGYVVTDYTTETDENCDCIINLEEGECALCDDRGEYCLEAQGVLDEEV